MIQTWILREDVAPHDALHSGEDSSVCGDCVLRPFTAKGTGQPVCYASCSGGRAGIVNIWRSYEMGNIPLVSPEEAAELLRGRLVRLGSYGDPAAIPIGVWQRMLKSCAGSIGYTHQWRTCDPAWSRLVMASVETPEERVEAKRREWRTFRVKSEVGSKQIGEVVCPGSAEAGRKLNCGQCMACRGKEDGRQSDIVITAHGPGTRSKS